jgi:DNA-binding MarR family transcriptional regulator
MVYISYMNKNADEIDKSVKPLFHLLARIGRVTEARLDAAFRTANLTKAKFTALRVLELHGEPMPLGQMAEQLQSVRSNATQMVDRLVAEGLVQRVFDPTDRRIVLAQLTEEGHRRYVAGIEAHQVVIEEILENFSLEEREQFIALLSRLEDLWS